MARRSGNRGSDRPPSSLSDTPRKVNLQALAEHLGLSRSTISLVLNQAPLAQRLSAQTRERVLQAAQELGYQPNYFARSLSGKRSKVIGVLAPDFGDGYDSMLLSGIERKLLSAGYVYFVSSHLWSQVYLRRSLDMLLERGAEGFILVNTRAPRDLGVPTIGIGPVSKNHNVSSIRIDNQHGMRLAVQHLVELGHTHIAFLKGHEGSSDTEERLQGFRAACQSLGMRWRPTLSVQLDRIGAEGIFGVEEGHVAMRKLLRTGKRFTAVVCFNDMSACGAVRALREAGLEVPTEVSVVGFDDLSLAQLVQPALTTIRQPLRAMGEQAATRLLEAIETGQPPLQDVCLTPELIVRGSTGKARAR